MIACNLNNEIIIYTNNIVILYLLTDWIHVTLILSDEFLADIIFIAAELISITAYCFVMNLKNTSNKFEENYQYYINTL